MVKKEKWGDCEEGEEATPTLPPEWRVPDGGWGWMVVAGSSLTHGLIMGMARSFGVLFVMLLRHFNLSNSQTAWVTSLFNMVRTLNSPVSSMLCEKYGSRSVSVIGAVICCVGISLTGFIHNLYGVYLTFGIIGGFGAGLCFTASYIIIGDYFDKNKGKAMGLSTMGAGIGAIMFGPLASYLSVVYGYFGTFVILGAIQLNMAVGGMLYRPVSKPIEVARQPIVLKVNGASDKKLESKEDHLELRKPADEGCCGKMCGEKSLIRNGIFLNYCVLMWAMQICIQAFLLFMPAFSQELGASSTQAALLVTLYGAGDIAGRFIFGVLFDAKRLRPHRVYIYCVISIVYGLVTLSVGLTSSYIMCAVMTVIVGVFQSGSHGQRATVVGDMVTKKQLNRGVGFLLFSQGLGSITGAPFAGYLRDVTGSNASSLVFSGIPIIIVSVIFCIHLKCHSYNLNTKTKSIAVVSNNVITKFGSGKKI